MNILEKKRSKIIHLCFHLRKLEKGEETKLKLSRRKQILKIIAEINKIEQESNKEKSTKPPAKLTKKKKKNGKIFITNIKTETGAITSHHMHITNIINITNNSMPTNLITLMKWTNSLKDTIYQKSERNTLVNMPISIIEIESLVSNLPKQKAQSLQSLSKMRHRVLMYSLYKARNILLPKKDKDILRKENYRPVSLMNVVAKIIKILAE